MQIFISHSSKNADYGNALVDLLTSVGIAGEQIIFTSNDAYGIPIGQNIFNWLKNRITEKPFVIYLLSPEYYKSVACLNEMGAAWVVENEHSMVFTPDFDLDSPEFKNGAIDPREIGFFINNEDKLTSFIDSLRRSFSVSKNPVLINQKIREFLKRIDLIKPSQSIPEISFTSKPIIQEESKTNRVEKVEAKPSIVKTESLNTSKSQLINDLLNGKLKDEEILMLHYVVETAKYKLGTGWQESHEVENVKAWEDIHELDNTLSQNYSTVLRRFEMRKLTTVSDVTSHGNPKEVMLLEEVQEDLLNLDDQAKDKILETVAQHPKKEGDPWF